MPAISSEGEDFCPDQTASRQGSAVLDDPRREAVHGGTRYLLDNGRKEAADRLAALSALAAAPSRPGSLIASAQAAQSSQRTSNHGS